MWIFHRTLTDLLLSLSSPEYELLVIPHRKCGYALTSIGIISALRLCIPNNSECWRYCQLYIDMIFLVLQDTYMALGVDILSPDNPTNRGYCQPTDTTMPQVLWSWSSLWPIQCLFISASFASLIASLLSDLPEANIQTIVVQFTGPNWNS